MTDKKIEAIRERTEAIPRVLAVLGLDGAVSIAHTVKKDLDYLLAALTAAQSSQRERELRLIRHAQGWENVSAVTCLEMFNAQEASHDR